MWSKRNILISAIAAASVVLVIVLLVVFLGGSEETNDNPVVDTNVGQIRGLRATDGTLNYTMFLGVPYATVDESNPFGPSIPHAGFSSIFEANDDSVICPQVSPQNTNEGSLDCLRLNIFVPDSASNNNRLPVMVWFHKGEFANGHYRKETYGPKYLIDHDVILVTLNYRMGPYGFMCLNIPEVPGNQGLKDQLGALRWINNNIDAFGGDVNKITLFGLGAGAHSIDFHLLSPQEKLFNNVIMQSGTSLAATVMSEPDLNAPIRVAQQIGFTANSVSEALSFLATRNPREVIEGAEAANLQFKPCEENSFNNVEQMVDHWINAQRPKVKDLPILIGFTDNEMLTEFVNRDDIFFQNLNVFHDRLAQTFNFNQTEITELENTVRKFYIGNRNMSEETKWELINFDSDFTYLHPVHRTIQQFINDEAGNVFYYKFSYNGTRNFAKNAANIVVGGAAHGDDISYLFDVSSIAGVPSADDQILIDRMTTMWTNFAKYSDPTPEITQLLPVKWAPIVEESLNYMIIDREMEVRTRPNTSRMAFWDLFYRINENLQKGYRNN